MTKNKKHNENGRPAEEDPTMHIEEATTSEAEVEDVVNDDDQAAEEADLFKKNQELQQELADKNMSYLRLMADFDNFRKRSLNEKADIIKNAAEKVLGGLLPIVDDFERGLEATKATADADDLHQGMELIYNKLINYLAANGVTPIESTGAPFDDNLHEAIATVPAQSDDQKGKVIDTTTKGYKLNDKVLRHAKVVVGE
ncbi:MAG: nucleotide exchange factor GrpE [Muribaculaceae bacterium]